MTRVDRTDHGTVFAIYVAPEASADVRARERVDAVAGRGLRGDRYFAGDGTYSASARDVSREITLIESETLAALEREAGIELPSGAHRRNVTTRGIALEQLVGERFRVGGAVCEGVERCEPCSYLERLLGIDGLYDALVDRGGIRARIVESGSIAVGDEVAARDDPTSSSTEGSPFREP
ncbi:MOSC domain-containing protein [Halalkalicoccus salilacus]|uniref:MOSC domain-containing protein n=1 Tax=Halalkalicoccus TaxID=332246 RepID=UPI002F965B00